MLSFRLHRSALSFSSWRNLVVVLTLAAACLCAYAAGVNARIRGVVSDPSDAVIPGAQVTATNVATGVKFETVSGQDGGYLFPQLPIGQYKVSATMPGFQGFSATGIDLHIDQEYVQPIHMTVGSTAEMIEVAASAVQVDTTDMQFSNIVDSTQMVQLPLIGRNFAGLQLTLPGVQSPGADRISGYSVSGSQQQQSAFSINGADSNDIALNTQVITPILDALDQFNLISGPMNAEYARNSGAIVSASIKSGTNTIHGAAWDFYRDTFLNTRNYFQKTTRTSPYHQHIVGGTVGAPIIKNKLFIFGAFQASPARQPQNASGSGTVNIYTAANMAGDFSGDLTSTTTKLSTNYIPSTISIPGCKSYSASNGPGDTWQSCLGATPKTGLAAGVVPTSAFNSTALALAKKYLPSAGTATSYTFNQTTRRTDYQYNGRVDFNPNSKNQLSFIGLYGFTNVANTLPFSGATVPGFGDGSVTHVQQYTFDHVYQINPTSVNDFNVHWTRLNFKSGTPQEVVQPSSAGFAITPQDTASATLPQLAVTGFFTLGGTSNGPQPRIDQTYQIGDSFSKVLGRHSLKFGIDTRRFNVSQTFDASNSGVFGFNNTSSKYGTGDPSLDFLLGIPASYTQGTGSRLQVDAFLTYLYAQDTYKLTNNLTLNYGLGYSIDTPMRNHQYGGLGIACFVAGEQSKIFPGSPKNLVFPGDPGCTVSGAAKTHYNEIGPRFGFSWSPDLGAISGGAGKFSIRGGFGIYFNRTEEESALQTVGTPPFGFTSSGAKDFTGRPTLLNPYADINGGLNTGTGGTSGIASESNRFPYAQPTAGSNVSFGTVPIFNQGASFSPDVRAPYAENFQISVEREFPSKVVARASYVGSLGRQNQVAGEANPETAAGHAACLASQDCIDNADTQAISYPKNKAYPLTGTPGIAEMGLISSGASSNYSAFQASVTKGETHGLLFQLSYTYAHALDSGSSLENTGWGNNGQRGFNQYNAALNYGDSLYDARQRLVFSPVYMVPFKKSGSPYSLANILISGWQVSGIVTVATGTPFDISYAGGTSNSLWCDAGIYFFACPDVPMQTAALVRNDPRVMLLDSKGKSTNRTRWFGTSSFADEPIGSFGNIHRNPYHGPGLNNTNMILAKNFSLGADNSRTLQLRMESDNVFNHTQFANPTSTYGSSTFGQISSAAAARQTQLAARFTF
jgi:hypothetical protein